MTSTVRAGLIGAGIGGASMFLLDPDRGARRRALIRDKAVWAARKTQDAAGATGRDLSNRLAGLQSRARTQFSDEAVDGLTRRRWPSAAMLVAGASIATGAIVAAAALRAHGDSPAGGRALDARTAPPSPEQEAAEGFETEIGILIVGAMPSEPGTFGRDEPLS